MQIMAGSENGGAENFFVRLSVALSEFKVHQKIITRSNSRRVPKLLSSNLSVTEAKFGGVFDYRTDKIIRNEFENFLPNIVISWMNRATFHTSRSLKKEKFTHVARLGGYYNLKYYKNCDYLIVGLQTDPTLDRPEKNKPIQSLEERKIQLEAVKYVDEIRIYSTEAELRDMLCEIWPSVRILGSDYITKDNFTGCQYDIPIYYHERNHDYSSSSLREKILKKA